MKVQGIGEIAPNLILNFLVKKGVKSDLVIKNNLATAANIAAGKSVLKEIMLAESIAPVKPKPCEIRFGLDVASKPFLNAGAYIGEVFAALEGEDGMDVFGNPIKVESNSCDRLNNLKNIMYDGADHKLYAGVDGYLISEPDSIKIMPEIEVDISEDRLIASISVCSKNEITVENMLKELSIYGVTFGVDNSALNIIAMRTKVKKQKDVVFIDIDTPVAFGRPSESGKDGYVEWYINVENEVVFEEDDGGNINFKETNIIKSIKKGSTIAVLHKHKDGTLGVGVDGIEIRPLDVEIVKLAGGKGTMVSDDGTIFMAEIDGMVSYNNNALSVAPMYVVEQNVDFSTGNVKFEGSVIVGKDILSGFNVTADQDLVVNGTVEASNITAKGNINIKGGIPGQGRAVVKTGFDLLARYISEAKLFIGGNIVVQNSLLDSEVECFGSIIASNSGIVGGSIFVNRGILCKNLGSNMGVATNISVGVSYEKFSRHLDVRRRSEALNEELKVLENDMFMLQNDAAQLEMLKPEHDLLLENIQDVEERMSKISGGYDLREPVFKIAVLGNIYPGVKVEMQSTVQRFTAVVKGPILIYYNRTEGKIKLRNIANKEIANIKKRFENWLEQKENEES